MLHMQSFQKLMEKIMNKDQEHELRINEAYFFFVTAKTPEARAKAWAEMKELIDSRSPEQIRNMEQEAGLCQ